MRIGNAPVSWGVYDPAGKNPPFGEVLDQIAKAGYEGTELGPYGYFPTSPADLKRELETRNLSLGSSYLALPLEDASRRAKSVEEALSVARLLASQGERALIVADDDEPGRAARAGRIKDGDREGFDDREWSEVARTLHAVARALADELRMRVVVHHHAGTKIETRGEIDRLLHETDPELVGLLLDTGHAAYGGADPVEVLDAHRARVRYVHLKDCDRSELVRVRTSEASWEEATRRGVFCPLGKGVVDFSRFFERLKAMRYEGWAIVEQDVIRKPDGSVEPDPFFSAAASRSYLKETFGI
jgi:inosose dehydratase